MSFIHNTIGLLLFYFLPWFSSFFICNLYRGPRQINFFQYWQARLLASAFLALFMHALVVYGGPFHTPLYFYLINAGLVSLAFFLKRHSSAPSFPWREILKWEIPFLMIYGLALLSFAFHPHLIYGEKAPDFQTLNFFYRYVGGAITNPIAGGSPLRYYYLGHFLIGLWGEASFLAPDVAYLAALSLLTSFFVAGLSLLFVAFEWSWKIAVPAACALLVSSNLAFISKFVLGALNFNAYWDSARIFEFGDFAEYPFFTYTFGDLHPHLIGWPFALAALAIWLDRANRPNGWENLLARLFDLKFLVLMSFLFAANVWDVIVVGFLVIVSTPFLCQKTALQEQHGKATSMAVHILERGLIFILCVPFVMNFIGRPKNLYQDKLIGLNSTPFHSFLPLFLHQGHFWLPTLLLLPPILFSLGKDKLKINFILPYVLLLLTVCLIPGLRLHGVSLIVFSTGSMAIVLLSLFFASRQNSLLKTRDILAFVLGSLGLLLFSELCVIMDHMNTVFKFRTWTFLLAGISMMLLFRWWHSFQFSLWRRIFTVSVIGLFSIVAIPTMMGLTSLKIGPRPTLEGLAFLNQHSPYIEQSVKWIQEHIEGIPTLVEAPGQSFVASDNLLSLYSGLPSYLGWRYHAVVRGLSESEWSERNADLHYIYEGADALKVYEFLLEKKLGLIVVGPAEKARYSSAGLAKFKQFGDLFKVLLETPEISIFGVEGNFTLKDN
ncbi:MAG: hypothetical protein A2X86_19185 [Bdellovibrionales bacterium GWA2_49_15]|nr:MAG: hypothetical protein A2X86_19185 [Bdellovibrionales bacterium GWA2_49_15]HAZ14353.1 hypothetical protein [Bdellovibrionales bacterium]